MNETLQLVFRNEDGGNVTISISDPRPNLETVEVEAVMDDIITQNIFLSSGGELVSKSGARIVSRDVTELF